MRAERPPQLLVPPLAEQVEVQLAQGGQEPVRVLDLLFRPLVRHEETVGRDVLQRHQAGEEAVPVVVQPDPQLPGQHGHGQGVRPEHPERDPAGHPMGTEHRVRIVVRAA